MPALRLKRQGGSIGRIWWHEMTRLEGCWAYLSASRYRNQVGSTRCRNQEDWCELNALQFGFAYVDRAAGSFNTTTSYGIRRLPKPLSIHCRLNRVSIHWEVDYSKFMSTRIFNIGFDDTAVAPCMSKQMCMITCSAVCRLATRRNCKLSLVMT